MKHRVFVALPVPSPLKKEIFKWQREHSDMPVRFLKNGTLHITIVPPWYTDNIMAIRKLLGSMEKPKTVSLTFTKIAFGPTEKNPRLIWATGLKSRRLQEAQRKFEYVLSLTPEKRPLLPHITIARLASTKRLRESRRAHFNHLKNPSSFQKSKIHWKCTIKTFCLMESHLMRTGAEYHILHTYLFSTHTRG
jgi:2'-5' RNA ligase